MTVNQLKSAACIVIAIFGMNAVNAALSVKLDKPKTTGSKTVVKLTLKNTFTENVEGARATVFLIGEQDKIIGQRTAWVIGGTRDKSSLKPNATGTYHFVIDSDKPVSSTRVIFNRLILEGGKQIDPRTGVKVEE